MAGSTYTRPLARGGRAMLHCLVERGGSATAVDLSVTADIAFHYVGRTMSPCRILVKSLGGEIRTEGTHPNAVYFLEGVDHAVLLNAVGPINLQPVAPGLENGRWTPELDALLIRWRELNKTAEWIAREIGAESRDVVLGRLYRLGLGGYNGGREPAPEAAPPPVLLDAITLPRVGGEYRFASGRLLRDGVPVEWRV